MSEFERSEPNYRLVETFISDTLQSVASRELGDANRWAELVWLNQLVYPYLTDDLSLVTESTKITGSLIKVPAPVGVYTDEAEKGQVYERDCLLSNKLLTVDETGDLSIAAGTLNLSQQLKHRVTTTKGQLNRHPEYGCLVWKLKGSVAGPAAGALGAEYVKSALEADYRVSVVTFSSAESVGDVMRISATAEAIEGAKIDISQLS
jgi:phage baseplate assembly protein W